MISLTPDARIAIELLKRSNWLYAHPMPLFKDSTPAEMHLADAHGRLAERLAALAETVIAEGYEVVAQRFPGIALSVTVEAVMRNWPSYTREDAQAIVERDMGDWREFQAIVHRVAETA